MATLCAAATSFKAHHAPKFAAGLGQCGSSHGDGRRQGRDCLREDVAIARGKQVNDARGSGHESEPAPNQGAFMASRRSKRLIALPG